MQDNNITTIIKEETNENTNLIDDTWEAQPEK